MKRAACKGRQARRKSFFLKKEPKNFYLLRVTPNHPGGVGSYGQYAKVFWFFFSKKNRLFTGLCVTVPDSSV
jgi:hypothetical protein